MSGFYIYSGHAPLGLEACGTDNKEVWTELKTRVGAVRRAMKQYPNGFSLYHFTDFYDERTYKMVHIYTPQGIPGLI